jgi:hypothetical protein
MSRIFGINDFVISILVVSRSENLNLIPKFDLVKGSNYQVCVQSKQPRKPHMAAEARNLALLDFIHLWCLVLAWSSLCVGAPTRIN